MSEDYYKARLGELERELAQANADIKMLEKRLEQDDEHKLWELYKLEIRKVCLAPEPIITYARFLEIAQEALKVWKERK